MFINKIRFIIKSELAMQLMATLLPIDEPASENEWLKARQTVNTFIDEFHSQMNNNFCDTILTDLYLELIDVGYEKISTHMDLPVGIDSVKLLDTNGYVLFTVSILTYQL